MEFGYAILYVDDAYWIAKKKEFREVAKDGSYDLIVAYQIDKSFSHNGFEDVTDALQYLADMTPLKEDDKEVL